MAATMSVAPLVGPTEGVNPGMLCNRLVCASRLPGLVCRYDLPEQPKPLPQATTGLVASLWGSG